MSTVTDTLSYALAKQVPAMERGFTISTSYGDIEIAAEDADPFRRIAYLLVVNKLAPLIAAEKDMSNGC